MPGSRGRERRRVTPAELAAWETGRFEVLRRARDASTPYDDEMPEEPWNNRDEAEAMLDRLRRA